MKTTNVIITALIAFTAGYLVGNNNVKKQELFKLSIEELNARLNSLIKLEDYETAVIVRDIINAKKKQIT